MTVVILYIHNEYKHMNSNIFNENFVFFIYSVLLWLCQVTVTSQWYETWPGHLIMCIPDVWCCGHTQHVDLDKKVFRSCISFFLLVVILLFGIFIYIFHCFKTTKNYTLIKIKIFFQLIFVNLESIIFFIQFYFVNLKSMLYRAFQGAKLTQSWDFPHGWGLWFVYFTNIPEVFNALRWRHNDHDGVSNHQPRGCLLNRLFRRRSKKTSKLRVTGLCAGNSPGPVNSPHKGPVTRKMLPFDDVIMDQ